MPTCSFKAELDKPAPHKGSYVKWYSGIQERYNGHSERLSAWWIQSTKWFGSERCAILCGACALLLGTAWWIVVPFIADHKSLQGKYDFQPLDFKPYSRWRTTLLVLIPCLYCWFCPLCGSKTLRGKRWWLYIPCVVYIALLVIGNVIVNSETHKREAFEQGFAYQFNSFYCSSRTVRVCLEGTDAEVLVLTRSNETAAKSSENATDLAFQVWTECRKAILKYDALAYSRASEEVGAKQDITFYHFLDDCSRESAPESDTWCGDLVKRSAPLTMQEHLTLPAPYAANRWMFAKYTRERTTSLLLSNVLIGGMVGCMVLVTMSLKVASRTEA